jgi:ABC-type multidrug transport system ATPase subunit
MAVCLVGKPVSKFLDECSTGLDPMSRKSMVKILSMEENTTVVFTTHSMNEAQAICTRIAILIKGELR